MKRHDILNRFISERNYQTYLEIGVENGDTLNRISTPVRVSVDPDYNTHPTYQMPSDAFFKLNKNNFDIIFIDGLHEAHQVYRDIKNSLRILNKNGVIVLHDCLPTTERMQERHDTSQYGYAWTGDVWKAFVKARSELPYRMYTIDTDFGCGVIDTAEKGTAKPDMPNDIDTMTYEQFVQNRNEWMNVVPDMNASERA